LALDHVDDGIVMIDNEGFVRLWNRAAMRTTGLPTDAVVGRPIGEAVPGWERIVLDIPVGRADENVTPVTLPLDTLDGRERWLSLYGVGFGAGTVYAFRDVTHERALERLRADMIATISHELRTPVASVYGVIKTLTERELEPSVVRDLLSVAQNESERLAALVDDILTTSQIEFGSLSVASEAFDPLAAVAAAVEATRTRGASITIDALSAAAPACGDEQKVHQILANLIDNAVKYGGAAVTIRVRDALDQVRFEVSDNGPGIPDSEQINIFEKFYRLDPQHRHGTSGTGLGLYICRELVRRMDGRIGVVSRPGAGATFWFQLPRA
jgi:PAS domain S-box-containing protein